MKIQTSLFATSVLILTPLCFAFEIETHTAITAKAIEKSVISGTPNNSQTLKKLGLFDRPNIFGTQYIDIGDSLGGPRNYRRDTTNYEGEIMKRVGDYEKTGLTLPTELSLPGWIMRGAIREDDNTIETPVGTPQGDEPNGVFERVYNHFYDPIFDRPLIVGAALGARAPDWAFSEGVISLGHTNNFSLPKAREAMWRALTGKTWLSGGGVGGSISPSSNPEQYASIAAWYEAERKAYWATTFRAVGDIVHLVQDMGQPQHTRNDAHAGFGCGYTRTAPYAFAVGKHRSPSLSKPV